MGTPPDEEVTDRIDLDALKKDVAIVFDERHHFDIRWADTHEELSREEREEARHASVLEFLGRDEILFRYPTWRSVGGAQVLVPPKEQRLIVVKLRFTDTPRRRKTDR